LNDKKISINELVHRLGMEVCPESCQRVSRLLKGKNEFRKPVIDKLIALTGIPYEMLFAEEGK
jgi:transcriptional regulator with XRE-family HTH domain